MSRQDNTLEVWLDDDLGSARQVGTLAHDRGQIRFHYERGWLEDPRAFALDPDLSLDEHPFFPKPELGNFGIFLDSSPDRWGQTLMKRREALQAKDEKRPPRTLYAWDFLIGVQDQTRQGALRFRRPGLAAQQPAHRRPRCPAQVAGGTRRAGCFAGRGPAEGQLHGSRRLALDRQVPRSRR